MSTRRNRNTASFEQNPPKTFEQDAPRSTWEQTQGKVSPTIVTIGQDGLGQAKHPAWRNNAQQRARMDNVAKVAHKHVKVRP